MLFITQRNRQTLMLSWQAEKNYMETWKQALKRTGKMSNIRILFANTVNVSLSFKNE